MLFWFKCAGHLFPRTMNFCLWKEMPGACGKLWHERELKRPAWLSSQVLVKLCECFTLASISGCGKAAYTWMVTSAQEQISINGLWINLGWNLGKGFQYQNKLCSSLMVEVASNLVCGCTRFLMEIVVWKMGLWLDVKRDPFQLYIQFLPTSQEIQQFVLPV